MSLGPIRPTAPRPELASTERASDVSPAQPAVVESVAPTLEAPLPPPLAELTPPQERVSRSADAASLWTSPAALQFPSREQLERLAPSEREHACEQLKSQCAQLDAAVEDRQDRLEQRWDRCLNRTRLKLLNSFAGSDPLPKDVSAKLDGILAQADQVDQALTAARARGKAMGPARTSTATREERHAVAVEMMTLRKQYTDLMDQATALIDAHGKSTELLKQSESQLLPVPAGEPSFSALLFAQAEGHRLLAFLGDLIASDDPVLNELQRQNKHMAQESARQDEIRQKDEEKKRLQKEVRTDETREKDILASDVSDDWL